MRSHLIFQRGGQVPAMPRRIESKAEALQALDRYVYCNERAEYADLRGYRAGGSVTGDRHRETAANWQEKADAALDAVRAFLLKD